MTQNITTLKVDLGIRSYSIDIGPGLIAELGARLDGVIRDGSVRGGSVFVVTDENVAALYLEKAMESLRAAGLTAHSFVLPAGEGTKCFAQLEALTGDLLGAGIERKSTVVALGGGVIGDLAGFAASIVLRGVDYVQVPTTLLSQVDSAVGGKTAIDTALGKNLIGSFYQPRLVLVDTACLDSLPRRELLAGYGEVVKYGALGSRDFFTWLEQEAAAALDRDGPERAQMIARCCAMKADIVARDEREDGARGLLNLGHTFGHALELAAGFDGALLHGEGVALGMVLAFSLAVELGHASDDDLARITGHMKSVGLPVALAKTWPDGSPANLDAGRLMEAMKLDKKVEDGRIGFVLPRGIGDAFISRDVPVETVKSLLERAIFQR